jgi:phosphatidate phosphatase APP1
MTYIWRTFVLVCALVLGAGVILLRYLRIKDTSFFAFMRSSREYKGRSIEALIRCFPERKFILVGDSGENDPAVYAAAARLHPSYVAKIYIRLVSPGADHRNLVAGYFKNLPGKCWELFSSGKQLEAVIAE